MISPENVIIIAKQKLADKEGLFKCEVINQSSLSFLCVGVFNLPGSNFHLTARMIRDEACKYYGLILDTQPTGFFKSSYH